MVLMSHRGRYPIALASLLLWALTDAQAATKKTQEAEALRTRAGEATNIRAEGNPAFHLRGRLRLVEVPNGPVEGHYQEIRDSRGRWRREIELPDLKYAVIEVSDGRRLWRTSNNTYPPYFEYRLRHLLTLSHGARIPTDEEVTNIGRRKINRRPATCVRSKKKGTKREMCFDSASGALVREKESFGGTKWTFEYLDYAPVGGKTYPRLLRQREGKKIFVELIVDALTSPVRADASLFAPAPEANEWPLCADPIPPRAVEMPRPRYPSRARRRGIRGRVTVYVVVGTDGRVYDATPVRVDSISLAKSTLFTVSRRWRFLPAMCQGEPVPVSLFVESAFFSF